MFPLTKDKKFRLTAIIIFLIAAMSFVEYLSLGYIIKSVFKIVLFGAVPFMINGFRLSGLVKPSKAASIASSAVFGILVYGFIIGVYALLSPFIDLDSISGQMDRELRINGGNFIYVAIYISIVNSLLEEVFFRGFAYFTLRGYSSDKYATLISAATFAVFHITMLWKWFELPLLILIISGLFISGLFFIFLNQKRGDIYRSWIVHMSANLAINTIGMIMFYKK